MNADEPHRHGENELQDGQTQGRDIDESASSEHKVGEGSLAGVAHSISLVAPLIIPTVHQDTIGILQYCNPTRVWTFTL